MCHLTTGIYAEKCVVREFYCVNIVEYTYTDLGGISSYTPGLHGTANCSWATACTTRYCRKQHEIKSSIREDEAIKRSGKHEIYEAFDSVTQYTTL